MVETVVHAKPLDKIDLRAMRDADSIAFAYSRDEGSRIRCIKRVRNPGPFDDREREHVIVCSTQLRMYPDDECGLPGGADEIRSCFELLHTNGYESAFRPVTLLARTGDELTLEWVGNNSNGYIRRSLVDGLSRLYRDDLYVGIRRNGSTLCRVYISGSLCPDNTARMVRRF